MSRLAALAALATFVAAVLWLYLTREWAIAPSLTLALICAAAGLAMAVIAQMEDRND